MERVSALKTVGNKVRVEFDSGRVYTLKKADYKVNVSDHYHNGVFQQRNEYMVRHSSLVIACYNGAPGGTKNTIDFANRLGVPVIISEIPQEDMSEKESEISSEKTGD